MIARVAPELMDRKNIVVLNDEAHHCSLYEGENYPLTRKPAAN